MKVNPGEEVDVLIRSSDGSKTRKKNQI